MCEEEVVHDRGPGSARRRIQRACGPDSPGDCRPARPGRRHGERAGRAVQRDPSRHLQAPEGARALRAHLANPARPVPALSPGGGGARRGRRLDRGEPADLERTVRQARRAPARHPASTVPARQRKPTMTDRTADTGELIYTRVFDAPRELVFRSMIEPEHLTHFWGPAGMSTPLATIKVDARPGGGFETVMVSDADGSQYTMRAEYVEIVEPERIVWTEPGTGMTTTSTFTDLGGARTEVQIRQTNVPQAARTPEVQAGFATSLDRFATYVEKLGGSR